MTDGTVGEARARISAGSFNGSCYAMTFACSSYRFRRCHLLPILPLPISTTAIKTTATSVVKSVNMEQLQQIIRVSVVWSGCSTFSYVHPMRALVYLGELKVVALIDTGSDCDAIDRDLSLVQEERGNGAFIHRKYSSESVCGFSDALKMRSEYASQCKITLTGALVLGGKVTTLSFTSWLTEFSGLGDPLIFGMPTIDKYGGIESVRRYFWIAGLWVPRFFPPRKT